MALIVIERLYAIQRGTATVVEHDGRITGYATTIGFFGHAVGETNEDLKALIGAAKSTDLVFRPPATVNCSVGLQQGLCGPTHDLNEPWLL